MATSGKYRYTNSDQVLSATYVTFIFKGPVRAVLIKNYGSGGSITNPKTTGSVIVLHTYDNTGVDNIRIAPGLGRRLSGSLFTGIKLKTEGGAVPNFEIESFPG